MRRSPHRRSRPRNSVRRQAPRPRSSMRGSWAIPATDGKWISQRFPDNLRADDGSTITMTNPGNIPAFKRPSRHYVPKFADVSHERRQLVSRTAASAAESAPNPRRPWRARRKPSRRSGSQQPVDPFGASPHTHTRAGPAPRVTSV